MSSGSGGLTRGVRAGIIVNVVLICALGTGLALGFVAFVRQLSFKYDLRIDTTAELSYALDPLAKQILRDVQTPVSITYVWGFDQEIQNRVLDAHQSPRVDLLYQYYLPILNDATRRIIRVLEEWSKVSPRISFRVIRDEADPQAVADYARRIGKSPEEVLNRVFLQSGPRLREIPLRRMMVDMDWGMFPDFPNAPRRPPRPPGSWRVHEELTATLRALLAGEAVRIAIPTGVNAILGPGTQGYHFLGSLLSGEGYTVEPIDLVRIEKIPEAVDIVFIPAAQALLEARSKDVLADFEQRGGRLLIVADPELPESYTELLEPFGCTLRSAMVSDSRNVPPHRGTSTDLESSRLCRGLHPIDQPLLGKIILYVGPCRPIEASQNKAPGVNRTPLLRASEDAKAIPIEFDDATGRASAVEARIRDAKNAFLAIALLRPSLHGKGRETRLVVFGGAGFLQVEPLRYATHYGNRDLLLNSLAWLADRESSIGLTPREEAQQRTVDLESIDKPFLFIAVIGLPLLAALMAVGVHFARRS